MNEVSHSRIKTIVKCVVFFSLAAVLFAYLNLVVMSKGTIATRGEYEAYYALDDDTADVVFVGASNVGSFFNGAYAYEETGIAATNMGSSSSPFLFLTNLIDEAEKTQDPDVYVIDLKRITSADSLTDQQIRLTTDMMDLTSENRFKMIFEALDFVDNEQDDTESDVDSSALDYIFPVIKYHDRFVQGDLAKEDYSLTFPQNVVLGYSSRKKATKINPQETPTYTDAVGELSDTQMEELQDLLDYCDALGKPVVFTSVPISGKQEEYEILNAAIQVCRDRGYTVIDFNTDEMKSEIGLDYETDYFNRTHVNYHGSEKYTAYVANYLKSEFDLPDRRGDESYYQWEDAYQEYIAWIELHS